MSEILSGELVEAAKGKVITSLTIYDDVLTVRFTDGSGLRIFDDGQCCCEHRYMNTDDDLSYHVGAQFLSAEVADGPEAPNVDKWGDIVECQFLHIKTSRGQITVANYNEHNGYYGGFSLMAKEIR